MYDTRLYASIVVTGSTKLILQSSKHGFCLNVLFVITSYTFSIHTFHNGGLNSTIPLNSKAKEQSLTLSSHKQNLFSYLVWIFIGSAIFCIKTLFKKLTLNHPPSHIRGILPNFTVFLWRIPLLIIGHIQYCYSLINF